MIYIILKYRLVTNVSPQWARSTSSVGSYSKTSLSNRSCFNVSSLYMIIKFYNVSSAMCHFVTCMSVINVFIALYMYMKFNIENFNFFCQVLPLLSCIILFIPYYPLLAPQELWKCLEQVLITVTPP